MYQYDSHLLIRDSCIVKDHAVVHPSRQCGML